MLLSIDSAFVLQRERDGLASVSIRPGRNVTECSLSGSTEAEALAGAFAAAILEASIWSPAA